MTVRKHLLGVLTPPTDRKYDSKIPRDSIKASDLFKSIGEVGKHYLRVIDMRKVFG